MRIEVKQKRSRQRANNSNNVGQVNSSSNSSRRGKMSSKNIKKRNQCELLMNGAAAFHIKV